MSLGRFVATQFRAHPYRTAAALTLGGGAVLGVGMTLAPGRRPGLGAAAIGLASTLGLVNAGLHAVGALPTLRGNPSVSTGAKVAGAAALLGGGAVAWNAWQHRERGGMGPIRDAYARLRAGDTVGITTDFRLLSAPSADPATPGADLRARDMRVTGPAVAGASRTAGGRPELLYPVVNPSDGAAGWAWIGPAAINLGVIP